jgi:hypothetical protein
VPALTVPVLSLPALILTVLILIVPAEVQAGGRMIVPPESSGMFA